MNNKYVTYKSLFVKNFLWNILPTSSVPCNMIHLSIQRMFVPTLGQTMDKFVICICGYDSALIVWYPGSQKRRHQPRLA